MNYEDFKKEFVGYFAFKPVDRPDFEQELNDYYTEYKADPMFKTMTLKDFCEFYFKEWDLKTHHMALMSRVTKGTNLEALKRLATKKI